MTVHIRALGPDGTQIGEWRTHENGEHEVMQRDEDGTEHGIHGVRGFSISGRNGADEITPKDVGSNASELVAEEMEDADSEPYAIDDEMLKEDDARARAYMAVWDHYECAYNATRHRVSIDNYFHQLVDLLSAIMGRTITLGGDDDPPFSTALWDAGQERSRLLSQIERVQETLGVQANSVASQQRLIQEFVGHATRGKAATELLRGLAIWVGAKANGSPEELAASIKSALSRTPSDG